MRSWRTVDLVGLLALAVLLALPAVAPSWLVGDLAMYLSYALLAVALAFAWGHCGLLSLGHGVFFGIGAYAMGTLTLGMLPGLEAVRSTWLGLVFAVIASGATAWTIGWFTFAGRGLHGAFFGIVTLALAVVFERLAINWDWLGGLNGLMNVPPITLGPNGDGAELWEPVPLFYVMLGVLAATVAGLTAYQRSDRGLALAALRENELRARALGYDTGALKRRAFALSGAVAGLAGALFVVQFGFASPALIGFSLSAEALIWVALGGRGELVSAAVGVIALRLLDSQFSSSLEAWWPLVVGLIFMAVVVLLPRGIVGEAVYRIARQRGR
ncbi:branched-chain amino acid ABC transporter permease [Thalassobaculum fulvum]|uniref:Branched-chain amino acid ABC transporter permease n=1 Tax=Thalassobaculum fulvum TaxID=1633335 RepID=A0A919CS68_9PROT|nr:branched-chain amino acid ABC transporter permease [Thalassobaculum fulvum]GHD62835.1 branched-chain amino acid ABC transporter permease [Thalassobaculum fulvum]